MSTPNLSRTVLLLASLLAGCSEAAPAAAPATSSGPQTPFPSGPSGPALAALNERLPQVGEPLPAIVGTTLDGERIDNDALHGRTVLLNLWFVH